MQLTAALPPAASNWLPMNVNVDVTTRIRDISVVLQLDIDDSSSIRDVKVKVADAIGIPSHRQLKVYCDTKLLNNRCQAKNFPHLSVRLPGNETTVTFVDTSTNLKMSVKMDNNCPFAAALSNWFHLFEGSIKLYANQTPCNLMTTPKDIGADKVVKIVSERRRIL